MSEDVNLSTLHIRSSRRNSFSTINYSSLSGVAIMGQRDEGGGGAAGTQRLGLEGGLRAVYRFSYKDKQKHAASVPVTFRYN